MAGVRHVLEELKTVPATLMFFESPQRLGQSLADMAQILGGRPAAVARELTKLHEEVRRGPLSELSARYERSEPPKGEITVLVGPPGKFIVDTVRSDSLLSKALVFMPVRAAVDLVAEALDGPRHAIYERALEMKHER